MQKALDRYRGLSSGGKILVGGVAGVLVVFALSFLFSVGAFWLLSAGNDEEPSQQQPPEQPADPDETPDVDLEITRAEWNEDRVEVEGQWAGELSSVSCDLFEGEESEDLAIVEWWDRAIPTTYDTPGQTFTQVFTATNQKGPEDSIDPATPYSVLCEGAFSMGITTGDLAPANGTPPAIASRGKAES